MLLLFIWYWERERKRLSDRFEKKSRMEKRNRMAIRKERLSHDHDLRMTETRRLSFSLKRSQIWIMSFNIANNSNSSCWVIGAWSSEDVMDVIRHVRNLSNLHQHPTDLLRWHEKERTTIQKSTSRVKPPEKRLTSLLRMKVRHELLIKKQNFNPSKRELPDWVCYFWRILNFWRTLDKGTLIFIRGTSRKVL